MKKRGGTMVLHNVHEKRGSVLAYACMTGGWWKVAGTADGAAAAVCFIVRRTRRASKETGEGRSRVEMRPG